jgi:hypothetical protein
MPLRAEDIRLARARSQYLLGERLTDAAAAVRAVAGVQAQEPVAAALSIRVRTDGLARADVDRALVEERSIARLWAMRGTIHLVPSEDAAWLVSLLGPLLMRSVVRRLGQLGVPEGVHAKAIELIRRTLAERGPLTRVELMEPLARAGVTTDGQAAAHLPALAALDGGKPTYVLRDDWLGGGLPQLSRERALEELARRYARAFGPAEPEDFASWSGLPLRDARAGWAAVGSGDAAAANAGAAAAADRSPAAPVTRLLPAFDTYLLGYRSRSFCVPEARARAVWPGGGIVRPTVVVDGRGVGTWRRAGTRVEVEPFGDEVLDTAEEVADVRRFLGGR